MSRRSLLSVFAPDLFSARWAGPDESEPALTRLLSLAAVEALAPGPAEQRLFELFGHRVADTELPVAHVGAPLDGITPDTTRVLFRADPVHLRADPGRMFLFSARHLDLGADEADELLAYLNASFDDFVLTRGSDPARWYAHLPGAKVPAPPPASLDGVAVTPDSGGGDSGRKLRTRMNEIQMLLHQAPANAAREARGAPPVNSVWFWGAGTIPEPVGAAPDTVCASDFLARSLARHHHCGSGDFDPARPPAGHTLLVIGTPTGAAAGGAPSAPVDWAGVLGALRRGGLARVAVWTDSHCFTVSTRATWRPWRATRARAHWVRLRDAVLAGAPE